MRPFTFLMSAAVAGSCFMAIAPGAVAQVSINIGNVNNSFHPEHGYKGPMPNKGEKAEPSKRVDKSHFKGNEERRDGRGHATGDKR